MNTGIRVFVAVAWKKKQPFYFDWLLLFMERYDFLGNGLQKATYSDGSAIVGNFSDAPVTYEGKEIPAWGYVVIE